MSSARLSVRLSVCSLSALLASACASQANAVRPQEIGAGEASGERRCEPSKVSGDSERFAVDLSDGERSALEAAMGRGVAVVKYSCGGLEVLKGCSVQGNYSYRGISKKTKVVQMQDNSQIAANLGPATLPVAVQAEMNQGRALNLAYAMVGTDSTTVQSVSRDMLNGRCDEATHFVYEANLGAFAMDTSAKGEARAAAQVFRVGGASAGADSSKSSNVTDGELPACDKATDEATAKVQGCRALVRVTLFSIQGDKAKPADSLTLPDVRSCPSGFVYQDGACEPQASAQGPGLCAQGDVDGCKTQCKAGSNESCGRLSAALIKRYYGKSYSVKESHAPAVHAAVDGLRARLQAACDNGEGAACWGTAFAAMHERDPKHVDFLPEDADIKAVQPLIDKGCKLGDPTACYYAVMTYGDGMYKKVVPKDWQKMIDLVGLACDRGSPAACMMLGAQLAYTTDAPMTQDQRARQSLEYLKRACDGGVAYGCSAAGILRLPEAQCKAAAKDFKSEFKAVGDEVIGMLANLDDDCEHFGAFTTAEVAKTLFARGCVLGSAKSCAR